jgi:hypothetical protein
MPYPYIELPYPSLQDAPWDNVKTAGNHACFDEPSVGRFFETVINGGGPYSRLTAFLFGKMKKC